MNKLSEVFVALKMKQSKQNFVQIIHSSIINTHTPYKSKSFYIDIDIDYVMTSLSSSKTMSIKEILHFEYRW